MRTKQGRVGTTAAAAPLPGTLHGTGREQRTSLENEVEAAAGKTGRQCYHSQQLTPLLAEDCTTCCVFPAVRDFCTFDVRLERVSTLVSGICVTLTMPHLL